MPSSAHCPTCGNAFIGKYCYACGEKQVEPSDFTVKKFLLQAVDIFTHFEGKFFKTMKTLFAAPGKLTADYMEGRRVKYMKPLQMYLVINVLYFILFKSMDLFYIGLEYIIDDDGGFYAYIRNLAVEKAQRQGMLLESYIEEIDHAAQNNAKLFLVVIIPILALLVYALFYRKHKLYVPHLVFFTHFFTFVLASCLLYMGLIVAPLMKFHFGHKGLMWGFIFLVQAVYMVLAVRRFYRQQWWISIVKSVAVMIVFLFCNFALYRLMVTFLTLYFS